MKHKLRARIFNPLVVVTLFVMAIPATVLADSTSIVLEPTPVEVSGSEPFTVTLKINDVPASGMYAYFFKITFDNTVITFDEDMNGHDWLEPAFGTPAAFHAANAEGYISFTDYITSGGPDGDITLVRLYGTAIATHTASTELHFAEAEINDYDADPIPADVVDGRVNVWLAPVANFTWTYTDDNGSGTLDAGEQIQFTDTSTNGPTTWSWDFDDGNTPNLQNPTHSYNGAETYSVTLTASNPAGSDTASKSITVEPNSLDRVVVSPDTATVMVGSTVTFSAQGYDVHNNEISGITWTWEVIAPAAGSIGSNTGEFTASATPGTYIDAVKATGTYKGSTKSGYADVEVITLLAETSISKGLNSDGQAQVDAVIARVFDPETGETVAVDKGIGGYVAQFSYSGSEINILGVSGGDYPFDEAPTCTIDNTAGTTSFAATQTKAEPQPPITVSYMTIRLMGSALQDAELQLSFSVISDGNDNLIPQKEPTTGTFRRGDAKADGEVKIGDALFICQYLVGLRDIGEGLDKVEPVNAASAKYDGDFDEIGIGDALYIAQYKVGLRDANFNLK